MLSHSPVLLRIVDEERTKCFHEGIDFTVQELKIQSAWLVNAAVSSVPTYVRHESTIRRLTNMSSLQINRSTISMPKSQPDLPSGLR